VIWVCCAQHPGIGHVMMEALFPGCNYIHDCQVRHMLAPSGNSSQQQAPLGKHSLAIPSKVYCTGRLCANAVTPETWVVTTSCRLLTQQSRFAILAGARHSLPFAHSIGQLDLCWFMVVNFFFHLRFMAYLEAGRHLWQAEMRGMRPEVR
jgi:hypothetical protein